MRINTLVKINRPIKFSGLTSGQLGIFILGIFFILIVSIFMRISPLLIVAVLGAIVFISNQLFKKLSIEHKNGNPDYLAGKSVQKSTPRKILDRKRTFKILINN